MNTYAFHVRHKNGWGSGFGPSPTHCHKCGAELPRVADGASGGTGYGCGESESIASHPDAPVVKRDESLERAPVVCYACCAADDRVRMIETGRATLYLTTGERSHVSNWPGSLRFPVDYVRKGRHNMARVRYDVQFTGPDGAKWRGTQVGDNTQICHCRRLKA